MEIYLNGKRYILTPGTGIRQTPLTEYASQIRTTGRQARTDRTYISSWEFGRDVSKGLGIKYMDINNADDIKSIYDAEAWTHWTGQKTNPPLFLTPTIYAGSGYAHYRITHIFPWQSNVYGIAQPSGNVGSALAYKYNAPSHCFASYSVVGHSGATTNPIDGVYDVVIDGAYIYVAGKDSTVVAASYADNGYVDILENIGTYSAHNAFSPSTSALDTAFQLLPMGSLNKVYGVITGTAYIRPVYMDTAFAIGATCRADIGVTLSKSPDFPALPSIFPLQHLPVVKDSDNIVYYATKECLRYASDGNNLSRTAMEHSTLTENNPHVVMFNDKPLVNIGQQLLEYNNGAITNYGINRRQGMPAALNGQFTAFLPTWKYLIAGIYNATGSRGYLLLYDSVEDAWHFLAKAPSQGLSVNRMYITNNPDGVERLWVIWRNMKGHNYEYTSFFMNPLTNPLLAGTHAFATQGFITFPFFDGGLPEQPQLILGIGANGDGVSTADYITPSIFTSINGDTINIIQQYKGDYFPDLPMSLKVGHGFTGHQIVFAQLPGYQNIVPTGCYNETMLTVRMKRLENAGTAPYFTSLVMDYYKVPSSRYSYTFEVDVDATAKAEVLPVQTILANLESARSSILLVPFWYGRNATQDVKVMDDTSANKVYDFKDFPSENNSKIPITVAQLN